MNNPKYVHYNKKIPVYNGLLELRLKNQVQDITIFFKYNCCLNSYNIFYFLVYMFNILNMSAYLWQPFWFHNAL